MCLSCTCPTGPVAYYVRVAQIPAKHRNKSVNSLNRAHSLNSRQINIKTTRKHVAQDPHHDAYFLVLAFQKTTVILDGNGN